MIALSAETLVFIYVFVFLAAILLQWVSSEMTRRRRSSIQRKQRVQCMLCAMEYVDSSTKQLLRCPRCGSKNERA
jgi:DNA-directed RNA polymerase subunit RPC12/RpoP